MAHRRPTFITAAHVAQVLDLAVRIQQIPAPTFQEQQRAKLMRELFTEAGLQDISIDDQRNVYARWPGRHASRPLVVTAHLDAVFVGPLPPPRRSRTKIHGPGIGDNALGLAALAVLARVFRERQIELGFDLWLVANSCEEGLGDLRGMKEVVDRFGSKVLGYLVLEGTALGQIYHRAIAVRRYRITVKTAGGHSWSDYGQPSAVHEMAALITRLTSLELPAKPRTTLNVGKVSGGTGINVLASEARLELDLRSEDEAALVSAIAMIQSEISSARRDGVELAVEMVGKRSSGSIPDDHPLVQLAADCLATEGIAATLTSGSTDANVPLSRGIPAIVLGISTGANAHSRKEYIDTAPVAKGLRQLCDFVMRTPGDD